MTTVRELINELEKMPDDYVVLMNNNTSSSSVSVFFKDINVEEKQMVLPFGEANTKQRFVLLNQGEIN